MGVKFVGLKGDDSVAVIALYPETRDEAESASGESGATLAGGDENAADADDASTPAPEGEEDK